MRTLADKIIQPMISEKASSLEAKQNIFTVLVDKNLSKVQIAKAVEAHFGVKPVAVRTVVFRKKTQKNRYTTVPAKTYKKALVQLPEGKRLELK
jgi:ribosomal protein L23